MFPYTTTSLNTTLYFFLVDVGYRFSLIPPMSLGFMGLDWSPFGMLLLGWTRGTKVWYPKGHAHVSSPQVLGGVEDSSKDLKSPYMSNLLMICRKSVTSTMNLKHLRVNRRDN